MLSLHTEQHNNLRKKKITSAEPQVILFTTASYIFIHCRKSGIHYIGLLEIVCQMKVNLQRNNEIPRESKMKKSCDHPATQPLQVHFPKSWVTFGCTWRELNDHVNFLETILRNKEESQNQGQTSRFKWHTR